MALFTHRYGYICKWFDSDTWFTAKQENWRLTDTEILKAAACVHPKFYLGSRFGKSTRFAVIDIDKNSKYHTKRELHRLVKALTDAGLTTPAFYRSSNSGGWHLYLFFEEAINSAELRKYLLDLLRLTNFEVAKGTLEVFPHTADASMGYGLRLPLQPGFAWLDLKTLEIIADRSEYSPSEAIQNFLWNSYDHCNSYDSFRQLKAYLPKLDASHQRAVSTLRQNKGNVVPLRRTVSESDFSASVKAIFGTLPPNIIVDNWWRGRSYYDTGLTAQGQRAELIHCVGHYLFFGDPSKNIPAMGYGYDKERDWIIDELLATKHNGFSKDITRGRKEARAHITRATQWLPPQRRNTDPTKYEAVVPIRWVRGNAKRQTDARKRISDALEALKKRQCSFTTVQLQKAAGCSRETLYNHTDIWRKDYEDLASGFFANCTGEYNAVLGAGSSKTQPPDTSCSEIMPPGRLAARRIAYEIQMRSARDKRQKQQTVQNTSQQQEQSWLQKVSQHTVSSPDQLDLHKLKAVIAVLLLLLSLAPNAEAYEQLETTVRVFQSNYASRCTGPVELVLEHPPP